MRVGCYSMDIYCDRKAAYKHKGKGTYHPTGETRRECLMEAKKAGWFISRGKHSQTDVCPECLKEEDKKKAAEQEKNNG